MEEVAAATLSERPAVPAAPASVSMARVVVRGRVDEPVATISCENKPRLADCDVIIVLLKPKKFLTHDP